MRMLPSFERFGPGPASCALPSPCGIIAPTSRQYSVSEPYTHMWKDIGVCKGKAAVRYWSEERQEGERRAGEKSAETVREKHAPREYWSYDLFVATPQHHCNNNSKTITTITTITTTTTGNNNSKCIPRRNRKWRSSGSRPPPPPSTEARERESGRRKNEG